APGDAAMPALLAATAGGKVPADRARRMLAADILRRLPPRRLRPADMAEAAALVAGLGAGDAAATAAGFVALAAAQAVELCPSLPVRLLLAGPGRDNPLLQRMLTAALGRPADQVEAAGLDGAALPAQAIAFLAVRVLRGLPTTGPSTTGVAAAVGGGEI